uniref:Uncharacterized protein n=1 Tax=Xiphophorus couchianus TaxID=32473 RepID=A0A3B5MDR0_9TELE
KTKKYDTIADGRKRALIIHDCSPDDAKMYTCDAKEFKTSCFLEVTRKEEIVTPIKDTEVKEGSEIVFNCETNTEGGKAKWMKAGQEVTLSKRIVYRADGLKHTLTIKDCAMEDEGEYTAMVGDDKCAAELIISEAPTDFTGQLRDQTITEFEDAEFTCKLSKEKAAVKWYKNGREIREGPRYLSYFAKGKTCRLIIKVFIEAQTNCLIFTMDLSLFPEETPVEIIRPPQDMFEPPGSDVVFEVELNKDRVEVKWMRNNMIIVQGDKYQMISEGKIHRLQVCEIRPRDQGEYRIVAKDKDARAKLDSWKIKSVLNYFITFAAIPKIKTTDQNLVTDAGKPFIMTVPYDAYPRADADWFFDGKSLPVQNIDTSLDKTEYRLKSPTKEDQGRYRVVIKNKHGEGEAFINLDVIGKSVDVPGPIKNLRVVDTADGEVTTVNWEPPKFDGGSEITAYVIELRDRTSVKWEAALVCGASDRSATLNDVVEHKEYIFRVRAENKAGIGRPSAATNPRPSPPLNLNYNDQINTAVTLTWETPLSNGGSMITGYIIEKCDEGSDKWLRCNARLCPDLSYRVSGLKPGQKYLYRVCAENAAGVSDPADQTLPSVNEENIFLSTVGPTFDLSGFRNGLEVIVPQPLTIRVPITGYPTPTAKWNFGEKELTTADERVSMVTKPTFTELTISPSVRPDKGTYTLHLENDVTSVSGEIEVNVIGNAPKDFKVAEVTRHHVHLMWEPPEHDGGSPVTHYQIEKREVSRKTWAKVHLRRHTVTDVIEGKEYLFSVIACNKCGPGEPAYIDEPVNVSSPASKYDLSLRKETTLEKLGAPTMDLDAQDVIVVEGEKLHLNIPYKAIPTPKMVWQKDTVECKADDRLSMTVEMNSAHLELLKCQHADAGAYTITLENSLGTATGTINVKVIGMILHLTVYTSPIIINISAVN